MKVKEQVLIEKRKKLKQIKEKLKCIKSLMTRNRESASLVKLTGAYVPFPFVGVTAFAHYTIVLMDLYRKSGLLRPFRSFSIQRFIFLEIQIVFLIFDLIHFRSDSSYSIIASIHKLQCILSQFL